MKNLYICTLFNLCLIFFLIIFSPISGSLYAQDDVKIFHPLSGSVLLSLEYTETMSQTDYSSSIFNYGWRIGGAYYLPIYSNYFAGVRIYGGSAYLTGEKDSFIRAGLPTKFRTTLIYDGGGIEFGYRVNDKVYPYIFSGVTYLFFDPRDNNGHKLPNNAKRTVYSRTSINANLELGVRYFINDQIAVNASLTQNFNNNDYLDDLKQGKSNDSYAQFNIGVSVALFAAKDSDHDGVDDSHDKCPNTPPGVKVDATGCPLDSDGDGVPDYLDRCPNTPKGVKVDATGCPLDSDGDGVPDYKDKCPNTPKGVKVDSAGCPLDSDGDGVPDYLDRCPNTPKGVKVDAHGCPLDSDGDGVPDYRDRCPHTPKGVKVNSHGCPVKAAKKKVKKPVQSSVKKTISAQQNSSVQSSPDKYVFSSSSIFTSRSAFISKSAYPELDKIAQIIKSDSTSRWRIEGYTDFNNDASFNQTLSYNRANAIYIFFIEKGIDRNRFDIIGEGKYASYKNEKGKNIGVTITKIE